MAINKVVFGADTLIDLTADTVTANDLKKGVTAHAKDGKLITGTSTLDSDTSADTVAVAEILAGKTAHARGTKLTGTMPNRGAVTGTITTKSGSYSIPQGYHDGSGKVTIASSATAGLEAANIRSGIEILGVTGTMNDASDIKIQTSVTTQAPLYQAIELTPDTGYQAMAKVTVNPVSYTESENSAGGVTVVIDGDRTGEYKNV